MLFVVLRHRVKHENNTAHVDSKLTIDGSGHRNQSPLTAVQANQALLIVDLEFIFLS